MFEADVPCYSLEKDKCTIIIMKMASGVKICCTIHNMRNCKSHNLNHNDIAIVQKQHYTRSEAESPANFIAANLELPMIR